MLLHILLSNFAISIFVFFLVWLISVKIKDASIIDILWGPSLALPAVMTFLRFETAGPRSLILTLLVTLWALRLGGYLAVRNLGHGEDFRYQNMRKKAGSDKKFAIESLYGVYVLQCCVSFFVSLPVQIGQLGDHNSFTSQDGGLGELAFLGIAIFTLGILFEVIGDAQLRAFKKDPSNKGKLVDKGLWAWTRHPNYFGDSMVWLGLTMIALESHYLWFTVLSPVVMFIFLYFISGKNLLERLMAQRYPDYPDYKRRVSGFFPLPPKKS